MAMTKVKCEETGEIWESIKECAKAIGVKAPYLSDHMRFGEAVIGRHYVYQSPPRNYRKTIICLETGEKWSSRSECAETLGISASWLSKIIVGKKRYYGKRYREIY